MPEYYTSTCKMCGEDCDGKFCSWACEEEWNDGRADYDMEVARDRKLDEEWEARNVE